MKSEKNKKNLESKLNLPQIGKDVYIPTSLYMGHGRDDFQGGLCKVIKIEEGISAGKKAYFIEVAERPGHMYNWEFLQEDQKELKKEYGKRRGCPDPDYRPEFNDW